jgi:hypothetical protein
MRPTPTEYSEKLKAWKLAVCEWLGLPTDEVFDLDVIHDSVRRMWQPGDTRVWWKAGAQHQPARGLFDRWDAEGDMDGIVFTGWVGLSPREAEELHEHAGEKPEFMSAEEEARLRAELAPALASGAKRPRDRWTFDGVPVTTEWTLPDIRAHVEKVDAAVRELAELTYTYYPQPEGDMIAYENVLRNGGPVYNRRGEVVGQLVPVVVDGELLLELRVGPPENDGTAPHAEA